MPDSERIRSVESRTRLQHNRNEREVISKRIRAGIPRALKRWGGKKLGQRYRLTKEKLVAAQDLLAAGKKKAAIARQLGVSRSSIYRAADILDGGRVAESA